MAPDVSSVECVRRVRAMTPKNDLVKLPHGGGKVVPYGDPKLPRLEREPLLRVQACARHDVRDYIFAPDKGSARRAWPGRGEGGNPGGRRAMDGRRWSFF